MLLFQARKCRVFGSGCLIELPAYYYFPIMKKRLIYFLICILAQAFIIAQNGSIPSEGRDVIRKQKIHVKKAYHSDSLHTFKRLASTTEYDKNGNIIRFENNYYKFKSCLKTIFEFDSENILRKKIVCLDSLCNHHTIDEYDANGNIVNFFSYDKSGKLSSSSNMKYNDKGYKIEESTTFPSDAIIRNIYTYNSKDSLIQIVSKDKNGKITYDSKIEPTGNTYSEDDSFLITSRTSKSLF